MMHAMATLWDAALINDVSGVKNLLEDAMVPVDDANDLGETALHLAATKGHDDVVRVLLQHNANLVAKDWESGWTPLHRSMYNDHLSTSLLLLRHARFHFGKKFMSTYLHQVCDFANQSAIELLSSRLADIFQQTMMLAHYEQGEGGAMTRGGAVYTFGKADFQLGYHLPNADVQTSPRRVDFPTASAIVQISAGKYHTIALNALGECFVWGFGKGGRLGTGTEFDHVEPMKLMSLDQIPILKVAAGENHTLALSRSGQIFSWGSNSFGQLGHNLKTCTLQSRLTPKRIDAFRGSWMTDIAVSGCHSAAIRGDDGAVFTWGSNKKGQLGRKEGFGTDQPYPTPKLVDALLPHHPVSAIYEDYESVRAVQVALSDVHTSVILQCTRNGQRHGQVWQFGYGSNYPSRINFKEKAHRTSSVLMSDVWTPTWKVRGVDIVQISCAQNHSIALAKCGSVYTWGHNGQALSHHKKSGQQSFVLPGAPQSVSRLANYGRVTSICASQDHCAVVTEDGNLITWGCGAQNVLGHGQGNTWQPNPKRVAGVKKALAVTTGHQHTAVLVASYNPAPLTVDEDALSGKSSVPTLLHLVQRQISKYVDLTNCVTLWKYGAHFSAAKLDNFASEFMRLNWDAVLEMMGKERMDLLFELFLPPMESMKALELKATAPPQATLAVESKQVPPSPVLTALREFTTEKRMEKKTKRVPSKPDLLTVTTAAAAVKSSPLLGTSLPAPVSVQKESQLGIPAPAKMTRRKTPKFVSLDAFLDTKKASTTASSNSKPEAVPVSRDFFSPSSAPATNASAGKEAGTSEFPMQKPLRKPSMEQLSLQPPRKTSVSASPSLSFSLPSPALTAARSVLAPDGSEKRLHMSNFSLDAFIKKPSRNGRKKGGAMDSVEDNKPSWTTAATSHHANAPKKTLKDIQDEEEARAAAEAAAKARSGGFARPKSTVNSWGLCEGPSHISLSEVQKIQADQEFIEQQHQIMAQIEREREIMTKQQEKSQNASSRKTKAQKLKKQDGDAAGESKSKGNKKEKTLNAKETAKPKKKAAKQASEKDGQDEQEAPRSDGAKGAKSKSKAPRQAQLEPTVASEATTKQKEPRKKSSKQPKDDASVDPRSAAKRVRGRANGDRQAASGANDPSRPQPQVPFTPRSDAAPFVPSGNAVAAA